MTPFVPELRAELAQVHGGILPLPGSTAAEDLAGQIQRRAWTITNRECADLELWPRILHAEALMMMALVPAEKLAEVEELGAAERVHQAFCSWLFQRRAELLSEEEAAEMARHAPAGLA